MDHELDVVASPLHLETWKAHDGSHVHDKRQDTLTSTKLLEQRNKLLILMGY